MRVLENVEVNRSPFEAVLRVALEHQDLRIVDSQPLVREHALDMLRNAISHGLYPPGMRLVERDLCEVLGVSRTTVREALRQLQVENLIEIGKRRNITVAVVTAKDAEDIYLTREMLETMAVKRFVARGDENAVKKLVRIHKDLRKLPGKGSVRQLALMAGELYAAIFRGSGSKVITEMGRPLHARVSYLRMRSMAEPHRRKEGMAEWDRLIKAILAANSHAAVKAIREHLTKERREVVSRLRREEQQAANAVKAAAAAAKA